MAVKQEVDHDDEDDEMDGEYEVDEEETSSAHEAWTPDCEVAEAFDIHDYPALDIASSAPPSRPATPYGGANWSYQGSGWPIQKLAYVQQQWA
jgi:hypothetical protein